MSLEKYKDFMERYSSFQNALGRYLEDLIDEHKHEVLSPIADGVVTNADLHQIANSVFSLFLQSSKYANFLEQRYSLLKEHAEILASFASLSADEILPLLELELKTALIDSLIAQFEESDLFELEINEEEL